jgi:hypothetical protein
MFASLKNKIKEETGSDPTKLALSSPPQKIIHGNGSRGQHSRQGSGSSLGSLSPDGVREELVSSPPLLKRQDSSEIRLADGKVRIFLSLETNKYCFFGCEKVTCQNLIIWVLVVIDKRMKMTLKVKFCSFLKSEFFHFLS